jgi:hypothetical protein
MVKHLMFLKAEGALTLAELESFLPYQRWFDENPENSDSNVAWAADVWRYFLGNDNFLGGESRDEFHSRFRRYALRTPRRMLALACDWIDGFAFPEVER